MFIKCAGSAGLSMLSEKAFLLCLSSSMFELIPECRIYFSPRNSTWLDCIFLCLLSQQKVGNNLLLVSTAGSARQCLHASVTPALEREDKLCYLVR